MRKLTISSLKNVQLLDVEISIMQASEDSISTTLAEEKYLVHPLKKGNIYSVMITENGQPLMDLICEYQDYSYRENSTTTQDGLGEVRTTVTVESNTLSFKVIQEA